VILLLERKGAVMSAIREFRISNTLDVPVTNCHVHSNEARAFMAEFEDQFAGRGCYVFSTTLKGSSIGREVPVYIGKATRTFRQECFTPHKLKRVNEYLNRHRRSELRLTLLPILGRDSRQLDEAIDACERSLIQMGACVHEDLTNIKGTKSLRWHIKGALYNSDGRAQRSQAVQKFKTLFEL